MDYRYLGRSALKVSPLCLGAMMFGGETDETTSKRIIDKAFDQGVNFIDTADVYHAGRSEEIVGRAIAHRRDSWVIATKFGYPTTQGPNEQGQSRKWIIQSVEASLKRLGTDYIDILYFHRALLDAPLEEGVRAIGDLIRQGKVRYFGMSNFRGWRIAEIVRLADQLGIDRPVASEPLYNMVDRTAEVEQLPAAAHYGIGVVPYSPLARGVLTGKYAVDGAPPPIRAQGAATSASSKRNGGLNRWRSRNNRRPRRGTARHDLDRFRLGMGAQEQTRQHDDRRSSHRGSLGQLVQALNVQLGPEDEKFVDSLVPPGHASTPGYTDPGYPIEGRRV